MTRHDLSVDARDRYTGGEACVHVILSDVAAGDGDFADAAVVRTLRCGEAVVRKAERVAIWLEHCVLLLDPKHRFVLLVLLGGASGCRTSVGGMGLTIHKHHFAENEDVFATTNRIGKDAGRPEHAIALVSRSLVGRRTVKAPDRHVGEIGAAVVGDDLCLRTELRSRFRAVDPDVLSLDSHCCPLILLMVGHAKDTARPVNERNLCSASLHRHCSFVNGV